MKIQIETGVPIPQRSVRKAKYPFRTMNVGESFFLTDKVDPVATRKRVSSAATMFCNANEGFKFTTQVFDSGVRVWRVA